MYQACEIGNFGGVIHGLRIYETTLISPTNDVPAHALVSACVAWHIAAHSI